MDKILSARVDEAVLQQIKDLANRLHVSKKKIIESAILAYSQIVKKNDKIDAFSQTSGAWSRKESAAQLVKKARKTFNESMRRHHL
jgi:predicted transcriptional regulator